MRFFFLPCLWRNGFVLRPSLTSTKEPNNFFSTRLWVALICSSLALRILLVFFLHNVNVVNPAGSVFVGNFVPIARIFHNFDHSAWCRAGKRSGLP